MYFDLGDFDFIAIFRLLPPAGYPNMNVGVAHSEENPNCSWLSNRGGWISYLLGLGIGHAILLSIPVLDLRVVWTLTNVIHSVVRSGAFKSPKK